MNRDRDLTNQFDDPSEDYNLLPIDDEDTIEELYQIARKSDESVEAFEARVTAFLESKRFPVAYVIEDAFKEASANLNPILQSATEIIRDSEGVK
jgi:hypothetical protein